jgi:transcriptional regulator with XRE-family HTH domain
LHNQGASHNATDMLVAAQLRAARALVNWSRMDLAKKSGVSVNTIQDFEIGASDPKQGTIQKWLRALAAAGVEMIDATDTGGPGVRLRGAKGKR